MRLRSDVAWRLIDDEIVVFDPVSSQYLTIAGAGVVIWQALTEGADLDGVVSRLVETFEVTEDTAREDARGFLDSLRSSGLLAA